MNWSKIKNIMIFMLVAVNLFLICDIAFTHHESTALPKGTGESFQKVLLKHDIKIENYLLPQYYETRKVVDVEFYELDALSKMFFGKAITYESSGAGVYAVDEGKKLIVSGNVIEYTAPGEAVEKKGNDIVSALKELGFGTEGARFVNNEGLLRVFVDKLPIEGIYLDVNLSDKGEIIYLKGVWPNVQITKETEKVSVISSVGTICKTIPKGSNIDAVESVYVLEGTGKNCMVAPGWKLSCNGENYTVS